MKLKVITIDFWNTLFDSSNGINRNKLRKLAILKEIEQYQIEFTDEIFDKALKESWEFFNNIWMNEQRTPKSLDTIEFFWNSIGLSHNPGAIERIDRVFAESSLDYPPALMEGAKEALPLLAEKYKLAIVSDTGFTPGVLLRVLLEKNDILQYFSSFSFSDETGVSKPHKNAFLKVLNELNTAPNDALHIGDIEKTDVIGAKQIDMYAIRFTGDSTAVLNKINTKTTLADFELSHWNNIVETINKIAD